MIKSFIFILVLLISKPILAMDLKYQLYLSGKPAPTIIVGHHCGGAQGHSDDWAKQLQEWGFNAVNLDSFGTRNIGPQCGSHMMAAWQRSEETYEMAEFIKKQPWHKGGIGYIGFSHGGSTAIYMSDDKDNKHIDAIVSYYPWCHAKAGATPSVWSAPRTKTMMFLAEKDDWTPAWLCTSANKDYIVHIYKDAHHAFDQNKPLRTYQGHTMGWDENATKDSKEKTRAFFTKLLYTKASGL